MELIRTWMIMVTVSALVIAVADSLMPSGTVKRVGRLTGGLVLMLGILQPITRLDYEALYCMANDLEPTTNWEEKTAENGQLLKNIIEEETSAYVSKKAKELGCVCTATVSCILGEDAVPVPQRICIRGKLTQAQKQTLSELVTEELGIPAKAQTYMNEEVS